jgi:integrase
MPKIDGHWDGGYFRLDEKGRKHFYIRRMVSGVNYDVSTRCHTTTGANSELKRFEENPAAYVPGGVPIKEPILLDEQTALDFLTYCRDKKKNGEEWLIKQRSYVAWWVVKLAGVDLRSTGDSTVPGKVSLAAHVIPALDSVKGARGHRIATLKAIYSWLRKVRHDLSAAEDPTFGTLAVPQNTPAQWKIDKVIPQPHVKAVLSRIDSHWRDAMIIQSGTGWHLTEVRRFARGGSVQGFPKNAKPTNGAKGVLLCPHAKTGELLRTAVSAEVVAAGTRLRKHGNFSIQKYREAIKAECREAKISEFTPGRFRHTVATFAVNAGTPEEQVSSALNHKSKRTTKRFYATHSVVPKIKTQV